MASKEPQSKKKIAAKLLTEDICREKNFRTLNDLLATVKKGSPWKVPVKLLLKLHGNSRRGKQVNESIQSIFREKNLICNPEIGRADYYGTVTVHDPRDWLEESETKHTTPISGFSQDDHRLIYVGENCEFEKLQTMLIRYNFSQMPVLSNGCKSLSGVVTWRSIARYKGDKSAARAKDLVEHGHRVVRSSDPFLEVLPLVFENEFVLYHDEEGKITGIVTASDVAVKFNELAGPYLQLSEIESRLRSHLDRASLPQLKNCLSRKFSRGEGFRGATDMTFGEYIHALKNDDVWSVADIDYDRITFLSVLEAVRNVRNAVMHFQGGLADEQEEAVAQGIRLLRALSQE